MRVIYKDRVLSAPSNDPGIYTGTNVNSTISYKPVVALWNNTLTVQYSAGIRKTYSTITGEEIPTNTTIPLTDLPWAYHAADSNNIQMVRSTSIGYVMNINTQISP